MTNIAEAGQDMGERIQVASNRAFGAHIGRGRDERDPNKDQTHPDEAPPDYRELRPEPVNAHLPPSSANWYDQRQHTDNTSNQHQATDNTLSRPGTPAHATVHWITHIIRLPCPAELSQLQHELAVYNPDLARMSAAPPRMLSSKTYVLNFLPGQVIPRAVEAFGSVLSLEPYHEHDGWNNSYGEGSPSGEAHVRGGRNNHRRRG